MFQKEQAESFPEIREVWESSMFAREEWRNLSTKEMLNKHINIILPQTWGDRPTMNDESHLTTTANKTKDNSSQQTSFKGIKLFPLPF